MYTSFGMGSPSKRVETLSGEAAQKWHCQEDFFLTPTNEGLRCFHLLRRQKRQTGNLSSFETLWQSVYDFSHAAGDQGHPSNRPYCCGSVGFFGLCIYFSRLLIAFCSFQLFVLERQIISKPVQGSVSLCNWLCVLGPSLGGAEKLFLVGYQRRGALHIHNVSPSLLFRTSVELRNIRIVL